MPKYVVFAGMYSGTSLPGEGATIAGLFVVLYNLIFAFMRGEGWMCINHTEN